LEITFDPAKNEQNIRERKLSFERVRDFDFDSALLWVDARHDYGESGKWRWDTLMIAYTSCALPKPRPVSGS
jgi:uncharacterized DUF497 family protein